MMRPRGKLGPKCGSVWKVSAKLAMLKLSIDKWHHEFYVRGKKPNTGSKEKCTHFQPYCEKVCCSSLGCVCLS